jgi:hypothetical protein
MGKSEAANQSALKQGLVTPHFKCLSQGLYGCQAWFKLAFYLANYSF